MPRPIIPLEISTIELANKAVQNSLITKERLAVKMEVSLRTIERWLNGGTRPSYSAVKRLRRHIIHFFPNKKRKKEKCGSMRLTRKQ
jgi:transcriptional regulator with XRE-family HTH domain